MKRFFYCLGILLLASSCNLFDSGSNRASNSSSSWDGSQVAHQAVHYESQDCDNNCDSDEYCGSSNNSYACISQPCMVNSDCGAFKQCNTNSDPHQCVSIVEGQMQADPNLNIPIAQPSLKAIGEACTLDSECAVGICDPDINANGTPTTTKTCGRTSGGTNYGRGLCDTDCAAECKSGQTLYTVTVYGGATVCILNVGVNCKYICAQNIGQVCYTASTTFGVGTINDTLLCKVAGSISGCSAAVGQFGTCN